MAFERIADRKIQEAIDAGEFENLSNFGEKLDLDSYFALPAHLRMAYSVVKNANCVPQEVEMLNDVARLEAQIANAELPEVRRRLQGQLENARLRLNVALDRIRADARRAK